MRKHKLLSWLLAAAILWNIVQPAAAASAEGMEQMTEDTQHAAHSYVGGVCTECGEPHTDHSYADGICTVCGCSHTAHTYENRTETGAACSVCGYSHTHTAAEGSVCEVCGFAPEGAGPEEQPKLSGTSFHTHAICGNAGCTNAAHIAQVFQPIPADFTGGALAGGSYYLDRDIALTESVAVGSADRVYLCLNGRSLQAPDGAAAISGEGQVYLCDCTGTVHTGTPTGTGIWVLDETTQTRGEDQAAEPSGDDEPTHMEHTWQNGVCTGCGAAHTPHQFTNLSETGAECSVCGYSHTHTVAAGSTCEVCGFEQPASAHSHAIGGGQGNMEFQPLPADFTGGTLAAGSYYLSEDITLTQPITFAQDAAVTLCLNGHVLTAPQSGDNRCAFLLDVGLGASSATLNLTDCGTTVHKFTPNDGGLWVLDEANGTKTVTGGAITGGTGLLAEGVRYGGAIYVYGNNTVNIYGGNLVGNMATQMGGAVYMNGSEGNVPVLNICGGGFCGNASNVDGGAIGARAGTITIDHAVFEANRAATSGGAIYTLSGYTSSNTAYINNTARGSGAVWTKGTAAVTSDTYQGNSTTEWDAGAIYVDSGTLSIGRSTFTGNTAIGHGGAIYLKSGTVDTSNSAFTENISNKDGGAIRVETGTLQSVNTDYSGNKAKMSGGAIFGLNTSTIEVDGGTFTQNKTTHQTNDGNGGAIGAWDNTTLTIQNAAFIENEGLWGGAVRTNGASLVRIDNSTFTGNESVNNSGSTGYGGALRIIGTSHATVTGCTFTNNKAWRSGGAIFVQSPITISNTTITGNTAGGDGAAADGGGIRFSGSHAFSLADVTIQSNTTTTGGRGGGVFVEKGTLTLGGKVVMDGNALNSAANNLYIAAAATVNIASGGLAADACIGYTLENSTHGAVIVSSGAAETDVQYFSADGADLNVQCRYEAHENGKLILKIPVAHVYDNGTCTACGYAHTPHTYHNGTCTVCGYAHTPHTYHSGTCTVCSYVHTDHVYTDTTDEGAACTVCGYAHAPHTYENGTCTVCSHAHADHEYTNITNLGAACKICGYAHTHTYGEDDITCAACGFVRHYHPLCGSSCTCGGSHSAMEFITLPADFTGGALAGSYYLDRDIALTEEITVAANTTLTLCLNGHVLTAPAGSRAVTVNGTLNLTDCTTTEHKFTPDENGLWVLDEANGTRSVTGGVITGGNGGENGYGGAIYAFAGGTVRMYGGTIVGNTAGLRGGGVYTAGVFTMYGGSIVGNTVNSSGGGVFSDLNGECYMYGGTISDNTANTGSGGGIYAEKMEMTGGVISGNTVTGGSGGGIYGTHITISGGSITGNAAKGSGGGINVGTLMMTGGRITGNRTESGGGGAYGRQSGTQTLTGGQITDNTANDVTNNMQLETAGTIHLQETMAEGSAFGIYGEGEFTAPCDTDYSAYFTSDNGCTIVYTAGRTLAARAGEVHHHALSGGQGNLEFLPIPADFTGGTLAGSYYLDGDLALTTEITVAADTTLNLCLNGHVLTAPAGSRAVTVNGGELNLSDCNTTVHKFTVGENGLWVRDEANGTETVTGGVITGGNAGNGGAIYGEYLLDIVDGRVLQCDSVIRMYGGNLVGNTATTGGGVYSKGSSERDSTFALYGGSIVGNRAIRGGGVYALHTSMSMSGGRIARNQANGDYGGGICTIDGTLALCGGEISENTAKAGGGVFAQEANIQVSGAPVIRSNSRSGEAGDRVDNLYRQDDSTRLAITGSLTEGASIGISGEGEFANACDTDYSAYFTSDDGYTVMYTRSKTLAACADQTHPLCGGSCSHGTSHENVTFRPFPASFSGGNLSGSYYLTEDVTLSSPIMVPEGQTLNLCLNGYVLTAPTNKGAITVNGTLNLTDCKTTEHKFTPNSNGLWERDEQSGTETVTGGVITGGGSTGDDVCIHIQYGSMTMYGGSITGNKGFWAGGVYLQRGSFTMHGGTISGNTGFGPGGGGVSAKGSTLSMHGGSITGNTANYGGGVCLEGDANMQMHGGAITGNTVKGNGGGICVCDGTGFAMYGGEVTGNAAGTVYTNSHGGGVAVQSNGVSLHGGKITGNTISGAANNIQRGSDEWKITLGETMAEGSEFGIRGEGVFTAPCSTDHSDFFTPDAIGGAIVWLGDQTLTVYSHYHPMCGKSCTHSGQHGAQVWQALTSTFTGGELSGNYYLAENVALDDTITVPVGQTLNLCLSGKVLTAPAGGSAITVSGTLNLTDCGTAEHRFTPNADGLWVLNETDGTETVTGGVITGGGSSGVTMTAGSAFILYGGSIAGNTTAEHGGGVYQNGGSFTMYGGSIVGNYSAKTGGGVYQDSGSFTMHGGSITGNVCKLHGGGVCLYGGGMTMYGGAITGNTALGFGGGASGGVQLRNDGTLTLYGGTITGNTIQNQWPSNILLWNDKPIILGEAMAEGSSFGISGTGVFAEACEIDHSGCFTSDNEYAIYYTVDKTLLAGHYHPICGESCTCGGSEPIDWGWGVDSGISGNYTGNEFLMEDITLRSPITVPEGETLNLCLNGHVLTAPADNSAFIVYGTLNLCDCGTTEHKFTPNADGLWVLDEENGTKTITGGMITGGGSRAVMVKRGGTFNLHGGALVGNKAFNGGGVYLEGPAYQAPGSGIMNMYGGSIVGNTAQNGGGGVYVAGTMNMYGGSITNNTTAGSPGGGVCVYGTFTMHGGSIADNATDTSGGGVFVGGGSMTMHDGSITGNTAEDYGGGITVHESTLTMYGGTITGNTGGRNGGVYSRSGTMTLHGGTITGNTVNGKANNIRLDDGVVLTLGDTMADGSAFGIYGEGVFTAPCDTDHSARFTSDNGHTILRLADHTLFAGHYHPLCGVECTHGGEHGDEAWLPLPANFNGGELSGSYYLTADTHISRSIRVPQGQTLNLCLNGKTLETGNSVDAALIVEETDAVLNLSDCGTTHRSFSVNNGVWQEDAVFGTLAITGGAIIDGSSSAVRVSEGTMNMYGGTVIGSSAQNGGGVCVVGTDTGESFIRPEFYMYGGTITGNTASGNGGGVYVDIGKFHMYGGAITANTAAGDGGGVYVRSEYSQFHIYGGTITDNTAVNGGGVYAYSYSDFTMHNGTIDYNAASENGGGVYANNAAAFIMKGGSVTCNSAQNGGGVYLILNGGIDLKGGAITGNTASQDGGGVYAAGNAVSIGLFGGSITGNTVSGNANNIRLNGKKIILPASIPEDSVFGIYDEGVFTYSCNTDHSDHFTSDNGHPIIYLSNKTLFAGHYHP